ncbi:hypothetical protein AAVH_27401, partial [Aphelenchoides avenae]
ATRRSQLGDHVIGQRRTAYASHSTRFVLLPWHDVRDRKSRTPPAEADQPGLGEQ